ncbi:hypothetical protein CG478_010945 [Bacillus cytotoxicus]|nr:hypothetical protein CG483_004310 [Bacillus cytotoxicus]AWC31672.1 hypothetical protein CG482_003980 [Bacillus cytotoxicus]AWC35711.1 hypothetical protein CG481_003980 [Bacillus cytotoxicus]AWC40944.1 hypothetical protein CG480_010945 [Bacillus cytotoxicus]AWC43767.1 hypothetical protein CG479_004005 [Bacillus cytotoxicus]
MKKRIFLYREKRYCFTFVIINAILKNVTYFLCVICVFCLIMKKKDTLMTNIFIEKLFKIAYNQYSFLKFLSEYLED